MSPLPVVSNLPKATGLARFAICLAKAGPSGLNGALAIAEEMYGSTSMQVAGIRSAISGATLDDWSDIAALRTLGSEFSLALRPATVLGRISGARLVPLQVRVGQSTSGASVSWVGRRSPTPLSRQSMETVELPATKIAGLVTATTELVRLSDPAAENVVRQDLLNATAAYLDQAFLDPSAAPEPGVAPGSITYAATNIPASGTTAVACRDDLRRLVKTLTDAGVPLNNPYFVTDRKTLAAMALAFGDEPLFQNLTVGGGTLAGIPVLASNSMVADGNSPGDSNLVLLDASQLLLGDTDAVSLELARNATLQTDSAPDSPVTSSTTTVSLWQHGLVCWRVVKKVNFAMRRPTACAYLSGIAYGTT